MTPTERIAAITARCRRRRAMGLGVDRGLKISQGHRRSAEARAWAESDLKLERIRARIRAWEREYGCRS